MLGTCAKNLGGHIIYEKANLCITGIVSFFVFVYLFNDASQIQYHKITSFESSFLLEIDKDYDTVDYHYMI